MKTFKDYIYENKLFEEQCNKYLIDINSNNEYYEIDEGIIDWFKNLFKKTGSFLEKWFKRGGKKVKATENSGTFKITNRIALQNIKDLKNDFENGGYTKIFTNTYNYLNNYNKYIIDNIDRSIFENKINVNTILFEPKYAFANEKYPVSIILYSDKIQLINGKNGIHIFNFDMANIITGVNENQMFKIFMDKISENKNLNYISYSVKDNTIPSEIGKIRYNGKTFEQYNPQYAMMTLDKTN